MHISDVQFQKSNILGDYVSLKINLFDDVQKFLKKYELPNNSIGELFKHENNINKLLITLGFDGLNNKQKREMLYLLEKTMFKEL